MTALARPTLVVVASLLVNRATANNNDDDDDESDEHLSKVAARLGQRPPLHKGGKGETGERATRGVAGGGAEASGWALRRSNF